MWLSREKRYTYRILVEKPSGKTTFITYRHKCWDIIKMS